MAVTRRDNWGGRLIFIYSYFERNQWGSSKYIYFKIEILLIPLLANIYIFQINAEIRPQHNGAQWSRMEHNGAQWSTTEHNGVQWSTMEHNGAQWSTIDQCHAPADIDIYILIDFTSPMVCSLGLNNRAGLVPSPLAYARNGGPRRQLKEVLTLFTNLPNVTVTIFSTFTAKWSHWIPDHLFTIQTIITSELK